MPTGHVSGVGRNPDPRLDLVHQFECMAPGPVPLVDHRDDRDPTVLAHLEQLQRLRLQPLRRIDQHHWAGRLRRPCARSVPILLSSSQIEPAESSAIAGGRLG